jgi:prevent-host-death family protein
MKIVNTHEAKTRLSELLRRVEKGEEVIIGRGGRPIARLTAYRPDLEPRRPGSWRGRVRMAEDFDDLPEEFLDLFDGREDREE